MIVIWIQLLEIRVTLDCRQKEYANSFGPTRCLDSRSRYRVRVRLVLLSPETD